MRFSIRRTSDGGWLNSEPPAPGAIREEGDSGWFIDIANLEALTDLIDGIGEPLIMSRRQGPGSRPAIEVYDDLREEFR